MTTRRLAFWALLWLCACHPPASSAPKRVGSLELPAELADDYLSFASNCSKCHQLARALGAHVESAEHWDLYVARMMRNAGSAISPHEKPKILRFLHWYTAAKQGGDKPEKSAGESAPPGSPAQAPAALTPPAPPSNVGAGTERDAIPRTDSAARPASPADPASPSSPAAERP